jgi:hypothetical protein
VAPMVQVVAGGSLSMAPRTASNQQHKTKRTITPSKRQRPSKITKKGTSRKRALEVMVVDDADCADSA